MLTFYFIILQKNQKNSALTLYKTILTYLKNSYSTKIINDGIIALSLQLNFSDALYHSQSRSHHIYGQLFRRDFLPCSALCLL